MISNSPFAQSFRLVGCRTFSFLQHSPLISFSPPLTYINDGPSPLLSSLSEFGKLATNISIDTVYIKVPGQDESLPINEIERISNYLAANYPSINVRTIINEYKVHFFCH